MEQLEIIISFRGLRDKMLQDCDWTQLSDSPLDSGKKAEWAIYRQALRDLPQNTDLDNLSENLHEVQWPVQPS